MSGPDTGPDLRGRRVIRTIDRLGLCYQCGSDEHTQIVPAHLGIRFTETGETARVGICRSCRVMWSERTPLGQEMRAELPGGKKHRSISIPGAPTRPLNDDDIAAIARPMLRKGLGLN